MGALGYVMQVPEEEKYLNTKKELEAMLVGYLGGRAAEELVFDTVTTGAANDIEQATKVARAMITQYGMSDKFGLMGLATQENQYLSGRTVLNCGDDTATEVVSFTTDCICGFPGETQADFEESCEFLKKIGFLKVHVFPYSRRSGTPAYDFPEQVHEREKQERSRVMNGIAEEVRREVLAAYVGTEDDVLLETPLSGTLFTGYTRLYIPVVVSAPGHESGQIVHVTLGEYDGERVRAALC